MWMLVENDAQASRTLPFHITVHPINYGIFYGTVFLYIINIDKMLEHVNKEDRT